MSQTTIPGSKAKHAYVTDECRANRGDYWAIDEAINRLRTEAEKILEGWPADRGMRLHFVLTIERPAPAEDPKHD